MTAQAKNKLLATIAMAMLFIIAVACVVRNQTPKTVKVFIPKAIPVVVTIEVPSYDRREFECLRANIYHEARGESRRGMEAIALVTINRTKTKHYPSTICGVVTQAVVRNGVVVRNKCQFSWFCDGVSDEPNLQHSGERKAWEAASRIAMDAMEGKLKDFLGRATHYHAAYVSPGWSNSSRMKMLTSVGTHIFYRDVKLKLKLKAKYS